MSSGTDRTVETAERPSGGAACASTWGLRHGVGKTYAMLNEGRRAKERGRDVVVGFVETYGRRLTEQAISDLEVIPPKQMTYRGSTFEEMDLDAILARRPERVLVDELAHTNVPGSRNEKRWQDVEELLAAGIDVISTLNIQHLESINDVVERITGIRQRETIPDEIVRQAEQVELIDITPEALRRRMAHGNIYTPEKIDAALANSFRTGNLGALRELALMWVADKVDVALEEYRERHRITQPWETRERVVVALTGAPGTEGSSGELPASPSGPTASWSACTSTATKDLPARPLRSWTSTASCSRTWVASSTKSPAPTWPAPWSTSRSPRTPPSSSSAPASGRAGPS